MADIGGIAADRLKAFVRRALNLEAEKAAIGEDIKEVYAEAKGTGFDTKTMRKVVARIKAMEKDREGVLEQEAIEALYNEALGIADGGAFDWGNMGRPNLHPGAKGSEPQEKPEAEEDDSQRDIEDIAPTPHRKGKSAEPKPDPLATPTPPPVTEDEARAMARKAVEEGQPIISNPFGHRDPNRRFWDEEWCKATGTDGMELPPEWRRKPKPKKDKGGTEGQGPDAGGGGEGGGDNEKNEGTES